MRAVHLISTKVPLTELPLYPLDRSVHFNREVVTRSLCGCRATQKKTMSPECSHRRHEGQPLPEEKFASSFKCGNQTIRIK